MSDKYIDSATGHYGSLGKKRVNSYNKDIVWKCLASRDEFCAGLALARRWHSCFLACISDLSCPLCAFAYLGFWARGL